MDSATRKGGSSVSVLTFRIVLYVIPIVFGIIVYNLDIFLQLAERENRLY